MKYIYTLLLLSLLSFNALADVAGSFTSPAGPEGREDNTELLLSDIEGYQIYVDGKPHFTMDNLLPASATTYTITVNSNAQVLTMTTFDTDLRESAFSNEVSLTGGKGLPKPPYVQTTITITIQTGVGQ